MATSEIGSQPIHLTTLVADKVTLIEESAIVALVCFVFLLHARSALVAIITLPLGILIA